MSLHGESVKLDGIRKSFGDLVAVDGVSVDIPAGSFFSLLGPSGCGKSTTLRMIAGFEDPDEGKISIGGRNVLSLSASRRPTAMVFQNYALFPHMTVGQNVAYGLNVRRMKKEEVRARVRHVLERVDMTPFENTPVPSLSGGQQQRVALARAIAVEPQVILFDEPLSNLDVALRQQTRKELKALQKDIGLTSLYVTHDQEEAMAMSDQIAVMRAGRIVQTGRPEALYSEPATAFVASFLGGANLVDAAQAVKLTGSEPEKGHIFSIRAEDIMLRSDGLEADGLEARVVGRQFLGHVTELDVEIEGTLLRVRVPGMAPDKTEIGVSVEAFRSVPNDL